MPASRRGWIDLVTSVVMEPDYRTYRIQQEIGEQRSILVETTGATRRCLPARLFLERRALPVAGRPDKMELRVAGAAPGAGFSTVMFRLAERTCALAC